MTILSKAHVFSPRSCISTIRQLKIIEEVKKLVNEMKNFTNATLTTRTVEKQTKPLKISRKILSLFIALFSVRVAGAAARD